MGTLTVSDNRFMQALDLSTSTPRTQKNPADTNQASSQSVSQKAVSEMGGIKNEKVDQSQRRYSFAAFSPDQVALSPVKEKEQLTPVKVMAGEALDKAKSAEADAEKMGIAKAKREMIGKVFSMLGGALAVGVAIAVTVLSGGAGVPLLALAGAGFALSIADFGCAVADYKKKAAGKEGLAMGSDALGNGFHAILTKAGVSDDRAKDVAKVSSKVINNGLTIATALTGVFAPAAGIGKLTGMAASATVAGLKPSINLAKDIASFAKDKADEKKGKLEKEQNSQEMKARALNNFEQMTVSNQENNRLQTENEELRAALKELKAELAFNNESRQVVSDRNQNEIAGLQDRVNSQFSDIERKDNRLQEQEKKLAAMDAQIAELHQRDVAMQARLEKLMQNQPESDNSLGMTESVSDSEMRTRF